MNKNDLVAELTKIVGADRVQTDDAQILAASKDYIGFRRYERCAGKFWVPRGSCVVRVKDAEQASAVLKFLNDNRVDVTPKTGGSSVTMGIEPEKGGVILDGSDMNKILSLNVEDMMVTALCGTPLEYLENYLNERGYTCGHYPQSLPLAQLGGLVATRSTGQLSTLYGGIEDILVGLEAVMADGSVVRIKNVPRRSTGPDLRHIFIGNEGALAFITEVTLKIWKHLPDERWMQAYAIEGMQNGLAMIREMMVSGFRPAVVRLHDPAGVERYFNSCAPEGHSLILLLAEGPAGITKAIGEGVDKLAAKYKAKSLGDKPVRTWLVNRNDVCKELDSTKNYDLGLFSDTCEISAPWSVIGKIYDSVLARLERDIPGTVYAAGHSSHSYMQGTNIYFRFQVKEDKVEDVREHYMHVIRIIMEETLRRDGSIAHHHGSGKYRTQWMPQEHGSSYPVLQKIKAALDPNNIMNKGVLFVD